MTLFQRLVYQGRYRTPLFYRISGRRKSNGKWKIIEDEIPLENRDMAVKKAKKLIPFG